MAKHARNPVLPDQPGDDYASVTEIDGQNISVEQLHRMAHRYHWAARIAAGKDVIEVGCGAGQGLGLLNASAARLVAGDVSPEVLDVAMRHFGGHVPLSVFGADALPFPDSEFDVVILFEAMYYLPDIQGFLAEARRVLRPGGRLLIVTANRDLYDFTPSPYSHRYLGVRELASELGLAGWNCSFSGYIDVNTVSARQRLLRPVKSLASRLGVIPKTMRGKELLKRLFFGEMTDMPSDVAKVDFVYAPPVPIPSGIADVRHKVIYCEAVLEV